MELSSRMREQYPIDVVRFADAEGDFSRGRAIRIAQPFAVLHSSLLLVSAIEEFTGATPGLSVNLEINGLK